MAADRRATRAERASPAPLPWRAPAPCARCSAPSHSCWRSLSGCGPPRGATAGLPRYDRYIAIRFLGITTSFQARRLLIPGDAATLHARFVPVQSARSFSDRNADFFHFGTLIIFLRNTRHGISVSTQVPATIILAGNSILVALKSWYTQQTRKSWKPSQECYTLSNGEEVENDNEERHCYLGGGCCDTLCWCPTVDRSAYSKGRGMLCIQLAVRLGVGVL